MLSKSQIKLITSLGSPKYRKINKNFIVEGPKLVQELLVSPYVTEAVYATQGWLDIHGSQIRNEIPVFLISEKELVRISYLITPNKVLAIAKMSDRSQVLPDTSQKLLLVLDNISDPGNMGTIIRTADWFGMQHILCSENCVDVYNPKVVQATMGSIFRVYVNYASIEKYFERQPNNIPVYATMLDGENLYEAEPEEKCILIIGNESHGISECLLPYVTKKIRIPDYSFDKSFTAESLNASVAAAIVIAEFRRKWSAE